VSSIASVNSGALGNAPLFPLPLREGVGGGVGVAKTRRQLPEVPDVLVHRAKEMRKDPTPSERELWRWLRQRRFSGVKFRRQQPLGPFIVDFYSSVARLVVELDGGSHLEKVDYDRMRKKMD